MGGIDKLVVIGVGLIGGSFSLALKRAGAVRKVVGVGRSERSMERALELGLIDERGGLDAATLRDASLVLLATPVGQMAPLMRAIAPLIGAHTIVTDGGSTKQDVAELARRELRDSIARFVPGHPIAGTEHSGPEAAFAELYRGRKVVLTPMAETDAAAVARVRQLWEACGANVLELHPEQHDAIFAAVSHLPHMLAFALVHQITRHEHAEQLFSFAASGFRDFTRIASSHPEMWRDICISNRHALLGELDRYRGELDAMRGMLERADASALESVFAEARAARERWLQASGQQSGQQSGQPGGQPGTQQAGRQVVGRAAPK
jgi:prephenate dehydrogenase